MQSKRKSRSRKVSFKTIAIFVGLMFVAYLPMTSFQFFVKNDAFRGYFPAKFFMSECVSSNNFPWWNPYINFGIPQYGDMNSGFWSPITWIFAYVFHYNAYTFTAELMLYLFLAGMGMYQLCRTYKFTKSVSYITGAAYLCSGYMIGHLQHFNWISGAAFLPWCIWGYHLLIDRFSLKNAIQSALIFYLFLSSAHPGLIIGGIYFFLGYVIMTFFQKKNEAEKAFRLNSFLRKHLWMLIPLLLLSYGLIVGYSEIIPYMTRGNKLATVSAFANAFTLQSLTSLLIPMATVKGSGFFLTDISMRNMYMGLLLLFFMIIALRSEKNSHQKFLLGFGLFFFLISLGGPFHYINYYVLPLMGYVRMPGEFIIFSLLCFLIFAAYGLNSFITEKKEFSSKYHRVYFFMQIGLAVGIVAGIAGILITGQTFLLKFGNIAAASGMSGKIKALIDGLSLYDALILQSLFQLLILRSIKQVLQMKNYRLLIRISLFEMVMATLLNIPFTGVGQASVKDVQTALNQSPEGIPQPFMNPVGKNHEDSSDIKNILLGDWSFYNKQIGTGKKVFYPVELNTVNKIFSGTDSMSVCADKPYLFTTADSNVQKQIVTSFKTNMMDVYLECKHEDTLVLQQSVYKNWNTLVNGDYLKPIAYKGVFNAVALKPGKNNVKFYFSAPQVESAFSISKIILLILVIYIVFIMIRRSSPS